MNKALLVTLADRNFVDAAKQLFSSAYFNAGWKGDYMLLSVGIPDKELEWFRKKGILVKKYNLLRKTKIGASKRNPVIISKFYLFNEEFKKWRNIIYLDSDIIIRAPIDKLAKVKGFCAAARDLNYNLLSSQFCEKKELSGEKLDLLKELKQKYNLKKPCFNAGVIAFNSSIINKNTFPGLLHLFEKYNSIHIGSDQPTFNLFFYNRWKKIPGIYNLYANEKKKYYGKIHPLKLKGIIIHILGNENRPWFKDNCFYNEWNYNLKKAELIDLNHPQEGKLKWNPFKIIFYSNYLNLQFLYYKLFLKKKNLKYFLKKIYWSIHHVLGICGKFIKRFSPRVYSFIKRL